MTPSPFGSVQRSAVEALPKVELHAHLFGCIRRSTLADICQVHGRDIPASFQPEAGSVDLPACFQYFAEVYETVKTGVEVDRIMKEVLCDFASENVKYLELRTGIKEFEGMTKSQYVEALVKNSAECRDMYGMVVRLILSINRSRLLTRESAQAELAEIIAATGLYPDDIVGIDISGSPFLGNLDFLLPRLRELLDGEVFPLSGPKLKLTVHIGEVVNVEADTRALLALKPDRLGHCCYMSDEDFDRIVEENIPVELCPTSNSVTMGLTDFRDHHFEKYWNKKHRGIAICSDDTGLFRTSLTDELMKVTDAFRLRFEDVVSLQRSALCSSFAKPEDKRAFESALYEYLASSTEELK